MTIDRRTFLSAAVAAALPTPAPARPVGALPELSAPFDNFVIVDGRRVMLLSFDHPGGPIDGTDVEDALAQVEGE